MRERELPKCGFERPKRGYFELQEQSNEIRGHLRYSDYLQLRDPSVQPLHDGRRQPRKTRAGPTPVALRSPRPSELDDMPFEPPEPSKGRTPQHAAFHISNIFACVSAHFAREGRRLTFEHGQMGCHCSDLVHSIPVLGLCSMDAPHAHSCTTTWSTCANPLVPRDSPLLHARLLHPRDPLLTLLQSTSYPSQSPTNNTSIYTPFPPLGIEEVAGERPIARGE